MPTKPDPIRNLTLRLPDSLRRAVTSAATRDGRSLSSYIRRVLLASLSPLPITEGRRAVAGQAVARKGARRG